MRRLCSLRYSFVFLLLALILNARAEVPASAFFTYEELTRLYNEEELDADLSTKLAQLLRTPFIVNRRTAPRGFPSTEKLGEYIRVAHWNIQGGIEFEAIKALLSDEKAFFPLLNAERFEPESAQREELLEQARMLREADIIVLNEVDVGMKRSGYRDVAFELAEAMGMNCAFGVQFIELSPMHISAKSNPANDAERELLELIQVDQGRYKGFHGLAILSRFPLENVRVVPFKHQPYDWFKGEKKGPGLVEKGKRGIARTVFLEETLREVRRGGRTTLLADIVDERFPQGRLTIAATHLENRTKPARRLDQLNELLDVIRDIENPVVLSGDMNTSSTDLTPTSIRREIVKRFGDPKYWVKQAATYALGFGMIEEIVMSGITFGRNQSDPTVKHIPIIAPNEERRFFRRIRSFRFTDGGAFDLRGDKDRSIGEKSKPFSNSNQRGKKGFVTTYQVNRPIMFIGKYKLDWIFIKPERLTDPLDKNASYRFAPHFGRTLTMANEAIEGRISDHRPMIVDLPLGEPR